MVSVLNMMHAPRPTITINWKGTTAQRPALGPAKTKACMTDCQQQSRFCVMHELLCFRLLANGTKSHTESILTKLMITIHALALNFMHAAELPKVPKRYDE